MNFCAKCGNQLKPDAWLCGKCGETISQYQELRGIGSAYTTSQIGISAVKPVSGLEFRMPNSQRRIVNLWLFLMAVFLFCVFLPSIIGMDGMNGGFFMSFMAGFCVIMSLVVILVYRSRAKQLDKILAGEGRIAVWHYTPDEWIRFIAADYEEDKKIKRTLFFVVAIISVIVGILLTITLQDAIVLLIITGIIAIVAIPAFLAPHFRYRKLQHSEATTLISEKGVIVGKMFHLWAGLGARLDQVVINTEEEPNLIEFTYSMPTRNGREEQVARLPIPKGKKQDAIIIANYFNARII